MKRMEGHAEEFILKFNPSETVKGLLKKFVGLDIDAFFSSQEYRAYKETQGFTTPLRHFSTGWSGPIST